MRKTQALRMNYEFSRVYRHGRFISEPHVVLHYLKRNATINRLGITASRKVNSSVRRNRLKRLLRESYRMLEEDLKQGFDVILVARHTADEPNLQLVYPEVVRLMRRAGLLQKKDHRQEEGA